MPPAVRGLALSCISCLCVSCHRQFRALCCHALAVCVCHATGSSGPCTVMHWLSVCVMPPAVRGLVLSCISCLCVSCHRQFRALYCHALAVCVCHAAGSSGPCAVLSCLVGYVAFIQMSGTGATVGDHPGWPTDVGGCNTRLKTSHWSGMGCYSGGQAGSSPQRSWLYIEREGGKQKKETGKARRGRVFQLFYPAV